MTKKIHPILKSIIPLARGISKTFGSNCEVVVHDLSHPKTSIIKIFNNTVTERKIGDGIRDLVWSVLRSPNFKEDMLVNYRTISYKNKSIKSTTIVIRDETDKPIGAVCINLDLSSFYNARRFLNEFIHININDISPTEDKVINVTNANVVNVLNYLISQTIEEYGISVDKMSVEEKIKIVNFLDKKGIFQIKGAANWVADKLKTSRSSVYNYLNIARSRLQMKEIKS